MISRGQEYEDFAHFLREADPGLSFRTLARQNLATRARLLTARKKVLDAWGPSSNPPFVLPKDLEPTDWGVKFAEQLASLATSKVTREAGEKTMRLARQERIAKMVAQSLSYNSELMRSDILTAFRMIFPPTSRANKIISG